jgi:hypothetical protein
MEKVELPSQEMWYNRIDLDPLQYNHYHKLNPSLSQKHKLLEIKQTILQCGWISDLKRVLHYPLILLVSQ